MMNKFADDFFDKKINRVRSGGTPRVLDLFSGCGGLSLGFHLEGFEIAAAVETDNHAIQTFVNNFFRNASNEVRAMYSRPRDITEVSPKDLLKQYDLCEQPELAIDVVLGGPPCQSFARVGRAKLREIASHPEAYLKDSTCRLESPRGRINLIISE